MAKIDKLIDENGNTYIEIIIDGKVEGNVLKISQDESKYIGDFKNGLMKAYGKLIGSEGNSYIGKFRNGIFDGIGKKSLDRRRLLF